MNLPLACRTVKRQQSGWLPGVNYVGAHQPACRRTQHHLQLVRQAPGHARGTCRWCRRESKIGDGLILGGLMTVAHQLTAHHMGAEVRASDGAALLPGGASTQC